MLAPVFARFYSDETPSLVLSFLVRGSIWAVAGMTAGLALGWGWQGFFGIPRAMLGGLAGSICGTAAFEIANAMLFPGDRNDAVIPSSMPARLLAYLLVAIGVAIGAVLFGSPADRGRRAEGPQARSWPVISPHGGWRRTPNRSKSFTTEAQRSQRRKTTTRLRRDSPREDPIRRQDPNFFLTWVFDFLCDLCASVVNVF